MYSEETDLGAWCAFAFGWTIWLLAGFLCGWWKWE